MVTAGMERFLSINERREKNGLAKVDLAVIFSKEQLREWGVDPDFFYALVDFPGDVDLWGYLVNNAKV